MNSTTSLNWYQANYQYLMASIDRIGRTIEEYIAQKTNKPIPTSSDIESALAAAAENLPSPSALDTLCNLFKLSAFERDILLLCAGVELDPNFEFLIAQAHPNSQRTSTTLSLALTVLNDAYYQILSPKSPLHYWQLISQREGSSFTQSPLQIDRRILCYLLGESAWDEHLSGIVEPVEIETLTSIPLPPKYQKIVDQISTLWQTAPPDKIPTIQLCGEAGETKEAIAAAACAQAGRKLSKIDAFVIPSHHKDLQQLIVRWQREALLSNTTLLLDSDEIYLADAARQNAISKFISGTKSPLIISSVSRQQSRKYSPITLDIPKLIYTEQLTIWQETLGSAAPILNGHIEKLACQFNLSPSAIIAAHTTAKSSLAHLNEEEGDALKNALWNACRIQARPHLDDLAQRIVSKAKWDDLVLPEKEIKMLQYIIAQVAHRAKVYSQWGFGAKGERGFGITALFSGSSGTGKTMAAEAIASILGLDLYRIELSAVVSKYIGETEKNLQRIFTAAGGGGAILLFDEADALFGKRTEVKDSHDRHANMEVAYLLQQMEAYQGLAILTTNLPQSLDQAFLRRLRFIVNFPFPDAPARAKIWQGMFPAETPTRGLDFKKLSRLNASGGSIHNITLNAAFIAADANEPVMMKHLLESTKNEYVKIDRLLTDVEVKGWV